MAVFILAVTISTKEIINRNIIRFWLNYTKYGISGESVAHLKIK